MKKILVSLWEVAQIAIISLAIIVPIRFFLIQPFIVKGHSMDPNFRDGQYLIVDEASYRLREPERGEVVVFKYPLDPSQFYIKRIIGLPGERVKVATDKIIIYNQLFPDGMELKEDYLRLDQIAYMETDQKLGPQEYFVLGDNRLASFDSRRWGVLPVKYIIGRAWLRLWPFALAQAIVSPSY